MKRQLWSGAIPERLLGLSGGITLFLFGAGCQTFEGGMRYDAPSIREPAIREIVYDTVVVHVTETEFVPGARPTREIRFTYEGQAVAVRSGETVRLIYEGVDVATARLEGEFTDTGAVVLRLVHRSKPVRLTYKCQTVRVFQRTIPDIETDPTITTHPAEQIIITPIYSKDCQHVGYEIRYGSTERGCKREAKEVLDRFRRCTGASPPASAPRRRIRHIPLKDLLGL